MGHWTPTGIEPTDYDDIYIYYMQSNIFMMMTTIISFWSCMSLGQPWVWSVSDFNILSHGIWWPVLSLALSSSHWQCAVNVFIIAELSRGRWLYRILELNFCPVRDLNLEPQSNTLTNRPPRKPYIFIYIYIDNYIPLSIYLDGVWLNFFNLGIEVC